MPCHVDPIYPSHSESMALSNMLKSSRKIADNLTAASDIIREELLGATPEAFRDRVDVTVLDSSKFITDGVEASQKIADIVKGYGFSESPKIRADGTKAVEMLDHLVAELQRNLKLYALVKSGKTLPASKIKAINNKQIAHRRLDLDRLLDTFVKKASKASMTKRPEWIEKIKVVAAADPTKPLFAQLGYDADEF